MNEEGTTVLLVTHDVRVAAGCSRVLYITDGNIAGEMKQGVCKNEPDLQGRERKLNNWLMEMGW